MRGFDNLTQDRSIPMTDEKPVAPANDRRHDDPQVRAQHDYVQRVTNFAAFLGRSPDTASFADVRRYQLHLRASGVGAPTINQTVSTLRAIRCSSTRCAISSAFTYPHRTERLSSASMRKPDSGSRSRAAGLADDAWRVGPPLDRKLRT